jgi:hypothetical protein
VVALISVNRESQVGESEGYIKPHVRKDIPTVIGIGRQDSDREIDYRVQFRDLDAKECCITNWVAVFCTQTTSEPLIKYPST